MSLPKLKLISHKLCPYVQRARVVLDEKSIPHEIEFIDLANKPQWFLELSPLGKVPVLLVDGEPLFESAVIADYLDEITSGSLHPDKAFEKARHRAWIEFASSTLASIGAFYSAADQVSFERGIDTLKQRFQTLDETLGDGPYFSGTDFSLVDAAFGPVFRYFDVIDQYADFGLFDATPKVKAWRKALRERPSIQNAVVDDYHERLLSFLIDRPSILSATIANRRVA